LLPLSAVVAPIAGLLLAAPPAGPAVAEIVGRVLAAYGGRTALERYPAVVQEGQVTAHESRDTGRLTRIFERPRRLRVVVSYPGAAIERRILDGTQAWRDRREVTGSPPQGAMVLQAVRMDLPLSLADALDRLVDEGMLERDGRRYRAVTLLLGEGMSVTAEIDPATGRIGRSVGRMPAGPGSLEFVTVFSDFREVSGTWVAFREESWVAGRHSGTTELRSVEYLSEAPTGAFRP
jgi:hypothetical protein